MPMILRPLILISALCLVHSTVSAQTTAATTPVGVLALDLPNGLSGISFPLISEDIAVGRLSGNSATTVTFEAGAGTIGTKLQADAAYYLEVLDGASEGERLDVDTAATIAAANSTATLDLGASSQSTLATIASGALTGVRAVIRPHLTLALLSAQFSPVLTGNNTASLADGVQIYGPSGFISYHLRGDGVTWYQNGGSTDVRSLVIPPDVSIIMDLKSGGRRLTHLGWVRTTAFRKNLRSGYQAYATGYPIDLTPDRSGAKADTARPVNVRWVGSNNAALADSAEIFDPAANSFQRFYLRADGTSWRKLGSTTNYSEAIIFTTNSMILIRRTNEDATGKLSPPFSL